MVRGNRLPPVLLLDLDDTIIDDSGKPATVERLWRAACNEPAVRLGLDSDALYQAIETHRTWYWADPERARVGRADLRAASAQIVDLALRVFGVADAAFARRIGDDYRDHREAGLSLLPGAIEALGAFIALGATLALITNGGAVGQRAKSARFELEPYFQHILIEGEFEMGKPEPEVYRHALTALGARPTDAWMVGDNLESDVAGAQRLGICGIWVDRYGSGVLHSNPVHPDRIITALGDLLCAAPQSAHPAS